MGLDRLPGGTNEPALADTRWRSGQEVWTMAKESLKNWRKAPVPAMADQIAISALASGHYSIWMKTFKEATRIILEIDKAYRTKGLFKEFNADGSRTLRENAKI